MAEITSSKQIDNLVGKVVEEFFQQTARGERPQLDQFVAQYPEISDLLKTVIPALQAAEDTSDATGNETLSNAPPKQLGDFRILRQIGRGGMGIVYEAEQISMTRRVALKVLPLAGLVDELKIRRFQNEVRAVAALDHPNIVPVYMVGEDRGVHYYAMRLIRGRSLSEVISSLRHVHDGGTELDGTSMSQITRLGNLNESADADRDAPMEPAETNVETDSSTIPHSSRREYFRSVAAIGIQAASALQHAHDEGIIHRDIKPANLMLDSSAKLYLTDFGLARIESDAGVTMSGDLIGTMRYMAPEQAFAKRGDVDHRADIYSLAVTLYELLTLRPAYLARDRQQLLSQIAFDEPKRLRRVDADIPAELETIVHKAMSKDARQRYSSAQQLADNLRAHLENRPIKAKRPTPSQIVGKWTRRNPVLTWASVITLSIVTLTLVASSYFVAGKQDIVWAHEQLSEIRRLIDDERFPEALALAIKVERVIPANPALEELWPEFSIETSITADPTGVDVSFRELGAARDEWKSVGTTPIDPIRLPKGTFHWKLTKKDYATLVLLRNVTPREMKFKIEKAAEVPSGMVRVKGHSELFVFLGGISHIEKLKVGEFLIDQYEVTNQQFQKFVDQDGYISRKYWKHSFIQDDSSLSWEDAVAQFVDSTGEPGPAAWKSGRYGEGKADYPVRGVSWFEAAAYAEFAGKRLPSVYHWSQASNSRWSAAQIVPLSNFAKKAPAPVGHYLGVGGHGAFDMAGNVKEWCFNADGAGKRYILGGAWNDPEYQFTYPDLQLPLVRSMTYGFRCVKILPGEKTSPKVDHEIIRNQRNFREETPVSDEVFAGYKSEFFYDKTPLNEKILSTREAEDYSHEKIEFDAAYNNERVTAHLYLPSHATPPYQTVIYFPPANVLYERHFNETNLPWQIAFLVRGGRAVLYPIYKGTFERKSPSLKTVSPADTALYRDHVLLWSKDLRRSIDYLVKRPDIEHEKLAYYGYSWGADLGAILPAVESRLRVAILSGAGFNEQKTISSVDQINFASRVTIPTLMLNGRYNNFYPIELAVRPMYDLLGTPDADKQLLVFDSGQYIPPKDLTKKTHAWLDKYFGSVKLKTE